MNDLSKQLLILLTIALFSFSGSGKFLQGISPDSPRPLKFKHIGVRENFPQQAITCIMQDSRGFMWFGSANGLVRFDGRSYQTFKKQNGGDREPLENEIFIISEDQNGILWLGSNSILERFDPGTERFIHYTKPLNPRDQRKNGDINAILPDAHGKFLWIGANDGLFRFHIKTGVFEPFHPYPKTAPPRITSIVSDSRNHIYLTGMTNQVLRLNPQTGEFKLFTLPGSKPGQAADKFVFLRFSKWDKHHAWLSSLHGLIRLNISDGAFTRFNPFAADHNERYISSISDSATEKNMLWITRLDSGLELFNIATGQSQFFHHDPNNPESLPSDMLTDCCHDRSGALWVGSYINGLSRGDNIHKEFFHFTTSSAPHSLSDKIITVLHESPSVPGTIWVGTFKGLHRYNASSRAFTHIPSNDADPDQIWGTTIRSFFQRPSEPGIIWIGTGEKGVNVFNCSTEKVLKHYLPKTKSPEPGIPAFISAIHESPVKQGDIFLGAYMEDITILNVQNQNTTRLKILPGKNSPAISVLFFHESPLLPGFLWLGTYEHGLIRLDIRTRTFQSVLDQNNIRKSTDFSNVYNLLEPKSTPGIFWLATNKGPVLFDPRTMRKLPLPIDESIKQFQIVSILEDQSGFLWLSSGNGIFKCNPRNGYYRHYNINDGLIGHLYTSARLAAANGALYFGSVNGLDAFIPEKIIENPTPPAINLTELLVSNKPVTADSPWNNRPPLLPRALPYIQTLHLPYTIKNFSLRFSAMNFDTPEKCLYSYKMEGLDDDWIQVSANNDAAYTALKPGKYLFRVKGCNNDGVWNETGTSLWVHIIPPWWHSKLAYFFYVLFAISLLFLLNRWQRRRLIHRERQAARLHEAELRAHAAEVQAFAMEAENRRKTQELEEARRIQLSMLPKTIPQLPFLEIAVYMKTASEVGGDYYDFFQSENNALTIVVGDATGHGIRAGTMVSIFKGIFLSQVVNPDNQIANFLNHSARAIRQMKLGNLFMGLSLIHIKNKHAVITSAGMPPTFLFHPKTGQVQEICFKTPPIGAFEHFAYHCAEIPLNSGDTLLLTSDGLPELFSPEETMYGYRRVKEFFAAIGGESPANIIAALIKQAEDWLRGKPQDDDITFVAIKVK